MFITQKNLHLLHVVLSYISLELTLRDLEVVKIMTLVIFFTIALF
jgi:hypothetical protein